ncbi:hypothetical protein ACLB1Q_15880 [Escherichia coli]
MGLGPIGAIYQAKFLKISGTRGLKDTSKQTVYAFLGDGGNGRTGIQRCDHHRYP